MTTISQEQLSNCIHTRFQQDSKYISFLKWEDSFRTILWSVTEKNIEYCSDIIKFFPSQKITIEKLIINKGLNFTEFDNYDNALNYILDVTDVSYMLININNCVIIDFTVKNGKITSHLSISSSIMLKEFVEFCLKLILTDETLNWSESAASLTTFGLTLYDEQ